jgi:hypothetical protein
MQIRSTQILALMAANPDSFLLDELGAPHRTDLKGRVVSLRFADGREIELLGSSGIQILDDFLRARLVYAGPLDAMFRRIYRLTPDGQERGKAAAESIPELA